MNAAKIGDIGVHEFGPLGLYPKTRFHAKREKGSDFLLITVPAGPKTKKTNTFRLRESELRALVVWLQE